MNHVSQLYTYFKSLADADEYVNTVTKKGPAIMEKKGLIFPLLDIFYTGFTYPSPQTKSLTFELTCLALRDQSNESVEDNFWGNDNEVSNLNETECTLNRIWLNAFKDFQDNNFSANVNPAGDPVLMKYTSLVDGHTFTIEIEVPNTTISLCS